MKYTSEKSEIKRCYRKHDKNHIQGICLISNIIYVEISSECALHDTESVQWGPETNNQSRFE